jgi:hypothetical protein
VTARRRLPLSSTLLLPLVAILPAACAATTYDDSSGGTTGTASVVTVDATAPATIARSVAEVLPQLADEASGLSALMIGDGDDKGSAERIDALWQAARQEVAANRPELLADFDANVRRCADAVRFRRAADADKAAANLRALVTAYLA